MMVARSTDWRWEWTVCVFIVHTDSSKCQTKEYKMIAAFSSFSFEWACWRAPPL